MKMQIGLIHLILETQNLISNNRYYEFLVEYRFDVGLTLNGFRRWGANGHLGRRDGRGRFVELP